MTFYPLLHFAKSTKRFSLLLAFYTPLGRHFGVPNWGHISSGWPPAQFLVFWRPKPCANREYPRAQAGRSGLPPHWANACLLQRLPWCALARKSSVRDSLSVSSLGKSVTSPGTVKMGSMKHAAPRTTAWRASGCAGTSCVSRRAGGAMGSTTAGTPQTRTPAVSAPPLPPPGLACKEEGCTMWASFCRLHFNS